MRQDFTTSSDTPKRWARWEWAALAAITLVAAFLRTYLLRVFPPGVHFDEAVYGLQAEEIYRGSFPIFFKSYTGREPFYMYLVALVYLFTGPNTFGLRLASALIGTLTVPITYLAFRQMFGRWVALVGAFITATAYWHFNVTRTGFCWTLMPLVETMAIYFLWRGYHEGKKWLFILGGIATGSTLYIYLAARFFPLTMLLILLYLFIVDRQRFRAQWKGITLAVASAALTFAPLGIYYLRNSHDFWERANQVGVWAKAGERSPLSIIAENIYHMGITYLPHLNMSTRYSLQGKPVFDILIGPFFLLGVAVALWRWRQQPYGILLLWWLGMSLPPILTAEPMPVGQRMFGVIPAIYGLAAVGMLVLLGWLKAHIQWWKAAALCAGVILAAEGIWNGIHYFTIWAPSRTVYYGFHSDYVQIAHLAKAEMTAGHTVIIASEHYKHPSSVFTEPVTVNAKWLVGKKLAVLPAWDGREIDYFVPVAHANPITPALQVIERVACSKEEFRNRVGDVGVVLYRICRPPAAEHPDSPVATLGDEVRLWGLQVPRKATRGEPLRVGIEWEVLKPASGARNFAVHLVDAQDLLWAQTDEIGYLPSEWQPGDHVWQWLDVPLDLWLAPGTYMARLILSGDHAIPLPVRDAQGAMRGVYVDAGEVAIAVGQRWLQPIQASAPSLGAVRVPRWTLADAERRPGETVLVEVDWQAVQPTTSRTSARLWLADSAGDVPASWEYPLAVDYPAAGWAVGEVVRQRYLLRLPADIAEGVYTLMMTLPGQANAVSLGSVRIAGVTRMMTPPPMSHPLAQPFRLGNQIELLGYDLDKEVLSAGEPASLTLYWRALTIIHAEYKVFVHLIDADGKIVSQSDAAPANWTRPTTGWITGEVVADTHTLQVPAGSAPGNYRIAVGMYEPHDLERLDARTVSGERLPDDQAVVGQITIVD